MIDLNTQRKQLEAAREILRLMRPWLTALDGITSFHIDSVPMGTEVTVRFVLDRYNDGDKEFLRLSLGQLSQNAQDAAYRTHQLLAQPVPPDPAPVIQIVEKLVDGPAFEIQRRERRTVGEEV